MFSDYERKHWFTKFITIYSFPCPYIFFMKYIYITYTNLSDNSNAISCYLNDITRHTWLIGCWDARRRLQSLHPWFIVEMLRSLPVSFATVYPQSHCLTTQQQQKNTFPSKALRNATWKSHPYSIAVPTSPPYSLRFTSCRANTNQQFSPFVHKTCGNFGYIPPLRIFFYGSFLALSTRSNSSRLLSICAVFPDSGDVTPVKFSAATDRINA